MAGESQALARALLERYSIPCMFRIRPLCLGPAAPVGIYELPDTDDCDNPIGHGAIVHQIAFCCGACLKRLRDPRMQGSERMFRTMLATMRTTDWRIEFGDLQTKLTTGVI